MNQYQRKPYPARPGASNQQRPYSQGNQNFEGRQDRQGGNDYNPGYRGERNYRDDHYGDRYNERGFNRSDRNYGYREQEAPRAPAQTCVQAPDPELLNKPGKTLSSDKILAMKTLSFIAKAASNSLIGLKDAFVHDDVTDLYVTPRDGKNVIVAAPTSFVNSEESSDNESKVSNLSVRVLSKQAMKKLREM